MRAGKLRTPVVFSRPVNTPDGSGGFSTVWGDDRRVLCEWRSANAREILQAGRLEDSSTALLTVRALSVSFLDASWKATITNSLGVDEDWQIRTIVPDDQRSHQVNITIEKGVAV